jgi:hypothetical protein
LIRLQEQEFPYLAGVFDSCGKMVIRKRRDGYGLSLSILSKNHDLLRRVWGLIDLGTLKPTLFEATRLMIVQPKDIKIFLVPLHPYLKIQKPQAELMIEFISLKDDPDAEKDIYDEMLLLNYSVVNLISKELREKITEGKQKVPATREQLQKSFDRLTEAYTADELTPEQEIAYIELYERFGK